MSSIFNPKRPSFDIMPLIGYVNTPDVFILKFLTECINNYSETTGNVTCHLTFQQGHLTNKKLRSDFSILVGLILDKIEMDNGRKKEIKDYFTVALDNATKSLTTLFEFNSTTFSFTSVSVPLDPEKQPSTHTRKKMYETFYLPGVLSIFKDNKYDLYTLSGKFKLLEEVVISKLLKDRSLKCITSFHVCNPFFSRDLDIMNLLRSEYLTTMSAYTGFNRREDIKNNFDSNSVKIMMDENGYYVMLG